MSNSEALEETITALVELGRIEPVDAARVQALRSMAEQLDSGAGRNSQMWREYREGLEGLVADGSDDGAIAELIAELRSPVRDAPPS